MNKEAILDLIYDQLDVHNTQTCIDIYKALESAGCLKEPSASAKEYGNMYGCYDANSKKTELYHSLEGAMYWHEKDPNRYFVSVYTEDVIRSHGGPENFLKALNTEPKSTKPSEGDIQPDYIKPRERSSDPWEIKKVSKEELKEMYPEHSKTEEEPKKVKDDLSDLFAYKKWNIFDSGKPQPPQKDPLDELEEWIEDVKNDPYCNSPVRDTLILVLSKITSLKKGE